MTLRSALARKPAPASTTEHVCPVCHVRHEVSAVRNELSYGRQLCCSPDCESERRRAWRAATRIDRAARFAKQPSALETGSSRWLRDAATIAVLVAVLAAGFAVRLHAFYPQIF